MLLILANEPKPIERRVFVQYIGTKQQNGSITCAHTSTCKFTDTSANTQRTPTLTHTNVFTMCSTRFSGGVMRFSGDATEVACFRTELLLLLLLLQLLVIILSVRLAFAVYWSGTGQNASNVLQTRWRMTKTCVKKSQSAVVYFSDCLFAELRLEATDDVVDDDDTKTTATTTKVQPKGRAVTYCCCCCCCFVAL